MYEGDMTECFPINETLLHSVQFENKIYDTAPQCLRNSSVVMLCTYAYMDFATRMLLRQAPGASLRRLLSILLVVALWSHWHPLFLQWAFHTYAARTNGIDLRSHNMPPREPGNGQQYLSTQWRSLDGRSP